MSDDCYVYVIGRPEGPVKVGISSSPYARLSTIQTSCPFAIDLAYVFQCPDRDIARHIERSFHETRREKCLHGEWFNYAPREAIAVLCIAFHVALRCNLGGDDTLVEECLEFCGVRAAEKAIGIDPIGFSEPRLRVVK